MIEINLLSEGKAKGKIQTISLEQNKIIYLVMGVLAVLLCVHVLLVLLQIFCAQNLKATNGKWKRLQPQRKVLEAYKKESDILLGDAKAIEQWMNERIAWSQKLNRLSLDLPSGIWFTEISIMNKEFILRCSAISLQKEEMGLINKFLMNLKSDPAFFGDFSNLDLGSIQKKMIAGYEVADFTLAGTIKTK